ncbi:DUF3570 domain-containing protein [Akkermansiaceae bacterium]|jgi:hypothetical protein|nr:DUF3570 domain-containing protein [Akkermansiaceae bacterium]MDA7892074.1 DUF3570 domain-containing protein [Akkermansiaceae bacterium]MDB4509661.1 DUF3570 domain-containing protein [Akkermansiaceae bacterium]MDF1711814.1 DUF3570 domain-containing protein [Akkermansiaceae bacterium]
MKNQKIIASLASASMAALGTGDAKAQLGKDDLLNTDFKGSLLYYTETDRVSAIEAIIDGTYFLNNRDTIGLRLTFDSLTGASASGAVPTDRAQTFTRPSGNGDYTTDANETPLDDTFLDTRYAVALNWNRKWDGNWQSIVGAAFSNEYDYRSLSANALVSYQTDDRNRTYSGGLSFFSDTISPVGGVPASFGIMDNPGGLQPRLGDEDDKTVIDALFSFTQVIDSRSLVQFSYSASASDGYLNDPYKFISVVGADGRPIVQDPATGLSQVVFENRPDSRLKQSFFVKYKRDMFDSHVFDASYRFMTDDWGINSHTLDLKYKWRLNDVSYLQPHLRIYQQNDADFFTPFLTQGNVPAAGSGSYASPDYRLGEMMAYTVGLEYGRDNVERPWSISLEYYLQDLGDRDGAFGELRNQDLSEDVSAFMVRFNMDF